MEFPDTPATRLTERVMSSVRTLQANPPTTAEYNRIYAATHAYISAVLETPTVVEVMTPCTFRGFGGRVPCSLFDGHRGPHRLERGVPSETSALGGL